MLIIDVYANERKEAIFSVNQILYTEYTSSCMNIENCPYCKGRLKTGKLVYRFEFRTPKIIFDDGTKKNVNTFNPFKQAVINKVFYCESCQVMLADLSPET